MFRTLLPVIAVTAFLAHPPAAAAQTSAGRERIEGIWKEGFDHQYELVKGMTKDDLAQLRHLCLLLVENARKELGK